MGKAVYFKDDSFLASVHPIKNNIALFQLQAVIYKRENYTFIFEISQLELVIILKKLYLGFSTKDKHIIRFGISAVPTHTVNNST